MAGTTVERPKYTATPCREHLERAREDICALLANRFEEIETLHALLDINGQQWRGLLKEEPPEYRPRFIREGAA